MTLAIVNSRAGLGIESPPVTIEVHLTRGMPALSIVGLPETAVKESKDRVRSAILTAGFEFPAKRITINLAPADLPKRNGGRFDLPIALGILLASKQLECATIQQYEFAGELALNGTLRRFNGVLPLAIATKRAGRALVIPWENAHEAGLVQNLQILAPKTLLELATHLMGTQPLAAFIGQPLVRQVDQLDLSEVHGQLHAKRALEIAAVGGHSLLMVGPPGIGKTMLAHRLVTILPEMDEEEALESAAIYSIIGKDITELWRVRPFRAPHHTISSVALVGGSNPPRPGEITLAHNGVLFLDELLEFNRAVLESLREPMESKSVLISRAAHQARFPAKFQLIVAMNPCPCGYFGDADGRCDCGLDKIKKYRARLSGPFLDRIDLIVPLAPVPKELMLSYQPSGESSAQVRARVIQGRAYALKHRGKINVALTKKELEQYCRLAPTDHLFLVNLVDKLKLSTRAYHKILRIARTIADLEQKEQVASSHLKEAVTYSRTF